ncbi:MAG: phosphate ABC transporter permease PstA [Clostridia bacterium]|nr:phosphate ABC transporter permease PstA [Clostridia bacterium]
MKRAKLQSKILRTLVYLSVAITICVLLMIVIYILVKGVPFINKDLFSFNYTSENVSLFPALINTITMTVLSLAIAGPIGVFSAVYLVEYAKKGNLLVKIIRATAETLSGIPSIVYGLFGSLFFVVLIFKNYCIMAGALTLAIMILPVIMRSTEEALMSVPDTFREGSFGLGAGKLRTVFKIILPCAAPGIFAGVVLSIGRIVGETAALIYTAGTVSHVPNTVLGSGRTLSVHLYALWNEGFNTDQAYATAVVLLLIVIIVNSISSHISKKIESSL